MAYEKSIPAVVQEKYEIHNFHHAVEIISNAFPSEWDDIISALTAFKITETDLASAGGSETNIPGKVDAILYSRKWRNVQIAGELHVKFYERIIDRKQYGEYPMKESAIPGFLNGQQIDYYKGRTAVYLEWNKKDIAFDKVLGDICLLHDCNIISAAVIITRAGDLNSAFKIITDSDGKSVARKYGASSTWMGRLLPKIEAGQAGGCPIVAIGIKKNCIEGY